MWRFGTAAGVVFIGAWFLAFAGGGLAAPFSSDDLMNLHAYLLQPAYTLALDNLRYWSASYRPLGGLFYVALYDLFGYNPLPFRLVCFALLGCNLFLLFRVGRQLSNSSEIAFLATFLISYHAWFVDLYYSSGTIYELLCFAFYFGALWYYIRQRRAGLLSISRAAVVTLLYLCALNAKEMAVTLPVTVALYELLYHPPGRSARAWLRWPLEGGRMALITAVLTVPYIAGKLMLPGTIADNPAYQMSISAGKFLDVFHMYLNPFLYQRGWFRDPNTVQLLVVMLGFALWRRSRLLIFAWCFLLYSLLPVAFIAHYSAFFMYIPSVGWALYAAAVLVLIKDAALRALERAVPLGERLRQSVRVALVAVLACILAPLHARESIQTMRLFHTTQPPSREVAAGLLHVQPVMKSGARILFVGDPYPSNRYFLLFETRLLYHDMTLTVAKSERPCKPEQARNYDIVFRFRGESVERRDSLCRPQTTGDGRP